MKLGIRRARKGDLPAIMTIERAAFPTPWPESAFVHEFTNDVAVLKVGVAGGEVVGYYDLWAAGGEAHLLNIAVANKCRGRGYGKTLLGDALNEARRAEAARLFLEVRPSNLVAVKMYEEAGFKPVRRRKRYYEDGEDADVLALDL
jgi:ribosomal-protein-alanine N-acetyltransferase